MTDQQYLALSQLAYQDFSHSTGPGQPLRLGDLMRQNKITGYNVDVNTGDPINVSPSLTSLSGLENWEIVSSATSSNGFGALALKNPTTGEIVFSFRGTNLLDTIMHFSQRCFSENSYINHLHIA